MADSGLRVAVTSYASSSSGAVICKDEVRVSGDAEVAAHPGNWATIDNAVGNVGVGRFAWTQIRP